MHLLDIILDPHRIPHRLPDTARIPKPIVHDSIPADSIPADSTDAVASLDLSNAATKLADAAPIPTDISGLSGDNLIWTVLAVIVALSLCFTFVRIYRQRNK